MPADSWIIVKPALQERSMTSDAEISKASSADIDGAPKKRQSPRKNEGRVIVCHRETLGVLVGATTTCWNPVCTAWSALATEGIAALITSWDTGTGNIDLGNLKARARMFVNFRRIV